MFALLRLLLPADFIFIPPPRRRRPSEQGWRSNSVDKGDGIAATPLSPFSRGYICIHAAVLRNNHALFSPPPPHPHIFTPRLPRGLALANEHKQAFDEMSRYGVTPSVITFNSLIDACGRAGDVDRARQVFSRLAQAGLRPNDRTFSALIHSHAVQGQVCKNQSNSLVWASEKKVRGWFRGAA